MPYEIFDDISLYVEPTAEEDEEAKQFRIKYIRAYRYNEPRPKKPKKPKEKKKFKKYDCECGKTNIYVTNRNIHNKSKKHNKILEDIEFQKNLKPELDDNEI